MNATIIGALMLVGGFLGLANGWGSIIGCLIVMVIGFVMASQNDPARNK